MNANDYQYLASRTLIDAPGFDISDDEIMIYNGIDLSAIIRTGPYAHMSWVNKFWFFVNKSGVDECWEWTGKRFSNGYGCFRVGEKGFLAHRVSYFLAHNTLGEDLLICHDCDNPPCINPHHLFAGTQLDNMADMSTKQRRNSAVGERVAGSKLTRTDVEQIRAMYASGEHLQRDIAALFGVSSKQISVIVAKKQWR